MMTEANVIVTSIKTTIEIVKGLKSYYDAHTITQVQSELLQQLLNIQMGTLTLQEKYSALINEKDELANKLVQFEQWQKTESEYELQEIDSGKYAYSSKNSQQSKNPAHWLCPQCWEDRKKSILQEEHQYDGQVHYICHRCKFTIIIYVSK